MTTYNNGYMSYLPGPDNGYQSAPEPPRVAMNPSPPTKEVRINPEKLFITFGTLVLLVICAVPVANAAALLDDFNYVFWAGSDIPMWLISLCVVVIILYMITGMLFFTYARPSSRSEQTIMMIAHTFITMLGLIFMMVSLSLTATTSETYNNLHRRCQFSEETHKVFEYSQLLHSIRRQPGCKDKFTVENCDGYQDAPPYTSFLKNLEDNFRCSGFCYLPPGQAIDTNPAFLSLSISSHQRARGRNIPISAPQQDTSLSTDAGHTTPTSIPQQDKSLRIDSDGNQTENATVDATKNLTVVDLDVDYPPALFSDSQYQISCDGTAARDMRDFAGDIGHQLWYQGLYLVSVAIGTGFLKLMGFCATFNLSRSLKAARTAYAKRLDF